ncbi:transcriptional regulator [Polymorphobacter multimanifer]|uniref:Putative transcriptional regulator n=1 Tax=Polymorphobacter multimanifer TaxID=1070431 RepID=A0A841L9R2_9SPHN|nr:BlaI/MecI/CopY family transcriptional regulator [Polymorphobacter multimanifer]MBB6228886.1 putative transcriptional regulator [Polymorphobacter multimanifer]GGI72989.1 transcriptional regulator [Polymorphobacter multimanifer]
MERIPEAEWQVMEILWAESPMGAQDVAERLAPATGWSLATVKTLLGRLLAKGALAHDEEGRRYLYRPAVAREACVAGESRRLVDRLFGGRATPLVAHLADTGQLSDADIAELAKLVKELGK